MHKFEKILIFYYNNINFLEHRSFTKCVLFLFCIFFFVFVEIFTIEKICFQKNIFKLAAY